MSEHAEGNEQDYPETFVGSIHHTPSAAAKKAMKEIADRSTNSIHPDCICIIGEIFDAAMAPERAEAAGSKRALFRLASEEFGQHPNSSVPPSAHIRDRLGAERAAAEEMKAGLEWALRHLPQSIGTHHPMCPFCNVAWDLHADHKPDCHFPRLKNLITAYDKAREGKT